MDTELQQMLAGDRTEVVIDGEEILLEAPGGARRYPLKPLDQLYGAGAGAGSVDPKDARFTPLMLAIEEEILLCDEAVSRSLTDGAVLLALGQLAANLGSAPSDPIARRVQVALRLTLSLNDYSRQEVRQGLRHVIRSVERHSKLAGPRGYLNFLGDLLRRRR